MIIRKTVMKIMVILTKIIIIMTTSIKIMIIIIIDYELSCELLVMILFADTVPLVTMIKISKTRKKNVSGYFNSK